MIILRILITFFCGGVIVAGIKDIRNRALIESSDILGIMFLLSLIITIWII